MGKGGRCHRTLVLMSTESKSESGITRLPHVLGSCALPCGARLLRHTSVKEEKGPIRGTSCLTSRGKERKTWAQVPFRHHLPSRGRKEKIGLGAVKGGHPRACSPEGSRLETRPGKEGREGVY